MRGNGAVVEELIHSDNPKFYKDESGQWWGKYAGNRTRKLAIRVCTQCGKKYLVRASNSITVYCSKSCFGQSKRGENNPSWISGRRITWSGYVSVIDHTHPNKNRNNCVLEHRLVMEKMLGRYLETYETVHHKNGIRTDNRPENLELWVKSQPYGVRFNEAIKHCPTCTCCKRVGEK